MITDMPTYSERVLNQFASKQWEKTLGYLKKQFDLSDEDCQDIFQESFIILHNQNNSGKLKELTSSLSTYFISICRNKAFETVRKNGRIVQPGETDVLDFLDSETKEEKINAILDSFDNDSVFEEKKDNLVQQIVRELPPPCNDLLWGFYRDNLSMKALAQMFNYKSENSVKVTKHRCMQKFRTRYTQLVNTLFD